MPITPDIIKANPALASLSEEQITAFVTLASNSEAEVINQKVGEHHGRIEADVLEVVGTPKKQGEKSYEYVKRVLSEFKQKAETAPQEIETYKAKVSELETALKNNKGNEAIAQKLKDAESQLSQLQAQYTEEKTGFEKKLHDIQVNSELNRINLKFKAGYPDSVQKTLIEAAKSQLFNEYKADFVEGVLVFRNKEGEIARNKANGLNPYTAEELLKERLAEVLDTGQQKAGAGTSGGAQVKRSIDVTDLAGARTQIEADEIIVKYLLANGFVRTKPEFGVKQAEIRKEYEVQKLPLR